MPEGVSAVTGLQSNLEALKRKKLFDAMASSINKPETLPMAGGDASQPPIRINVGGNGSMTGLEPLAEMRNPQPSDPNAVRPRYAGVAIPANASPSQRSQVTLEALQQAPPNSKIETTGDRVGWSAPKSHKGFWNRVGQIGKGAVISMGEYARTHPGAEAGELLGAGAGGGIVGGVSPVSIDVLQRQSEIGKQQQQLGSQMDLENQQAQTTAIRQKPVNDAERLRREEEERQIDNRREDAKLAEAIRAAKAREEERRTRPRPQRQPDTLEDAQGNKYLADPETGKPLKNEDGSVRYVSRAKAGTAEPDRGELIRNYDKRIGEYESKSADLRQQAKAATYQADIDRLHRQADEADKEAAELRTKRDLESAKVRGSASATPDKPETRKGSISKEQQKRWLADNPSKTLDDMKKLYPNARMLN
jgi:hypothetical protein